MKKTLLLVEDDKDISTALSEALTNEGYVVVNARNGREALDCLMHGVAVNLILLDMLMPLMTGQEFLEEIRNVSSLTSVPVIILSVIAEKKSYRWCLSLH